MPQDWNDIDLESYERDSRLIDPLSFDELLHTIECNLREITPENVTEQFEDLFRMKTEEARAILKWNLSNVVNQARKERKSKQATA